MDLSPVIERKMCMAYIAFEDVCKEYPTAGEPVRAANHVNFEIEKGELCVVLGPSGAGKTTVLNLLGLSLIHI